MYENIAARIPENIVKEIDYVAREENTDKSKVVRTLLSNAIRTKLIDIALEKYSKKLISLGRAAEVAKIALADFMIIAKDRKIALNYSLESLKNDFEAALKSK